MRETMKISSVRWRSVIFFLACTLLPMSTLLEATTNLHKLHKSSSSSSSSSQAYVTLLYGDEFALGVRVLGKSLRDTGTTKDMVALVSDGVSEKIAHLLRADGWIVEKINLLANPNSRRPKRFWGVYTKLKIFNMTNYKKVVYLDADTVVRKNIEDLFLCEKFCANLKHSEKLNSGVMVVEPSHEVFKDMLTKVATLPSYTGGDQGFLNSYYSEFPNAKLFNPHLSEEERRLRGPVMMERLSTLYNADVGLYMLANKWMVDESELRIIHYTLGPLKPWDWWTAWLLEPVRYWQDVRVTLEESLPGTSGGQDPHVQLFIWALVTAPILILLFLCRSCLSEFHKCHLWNGLLFRFTRNFVHKYSNVNVSLPQISNLQYSNGVSGLGPNNVKVPAALGALSIAACFLSAGISFAVALFLIPRQVMPLTGLLLLYEWTFFFFSLLYGLYLEAMSTWGKMSLGSSTIVTSPLQHDSGKGNRHSASWDNQTVFYSAGMVSLAILAPGLPLLFGVTALFSRLGMVIGGAMLLVSFMTYASQQLGVRWFLRGRDFANNQGRLASDFTRL